MPSRSSILLYILHPTLLMAFLHVYWKTHKIQVGQLNSITFFFYNNYFIRNYVFIFLITQMVCDEKEKRGTQLHRIQLMVNKNSYSKVQTTKQWKLFLASSFPELDSTMAQNISVLLLLPFPQQAYILLLSFTYQLAQAAHAYLKSLLLKVQPNSALTTTTFCKSMQITAN